MELYIGFIDNPKICLNDVLDFLMGDYPDVKTAEKELQCKFGNIKKTKANSKLLRNNKYGKITFNISRKEFWDYYDNADSKSEFDLLCMLALMALRSKICSRESAPTNSKEIFARMAGYKTWKALEEASKNGNGVKGRLKHYMETERRLSHYMLRIRTEIGRRYNCYADISTGRGFTFTDKAKNKKDARVLLQIEVEGRKRKNQYDDFRQGQRESKELKDSLLMRYAYDKFLKHVPDNKRPNESYCKQNFESFLTKAKERGYKLNYILQNVDSLVELLRTDKNNMSRSKKECCKKDEYGFI